MLDTLGPLIAVAVALLPGLVSWISGRSLVARRDDPLLPELLLSRQQRIGVAVGLGLGVQLVLPSAHWWLFCPSLLLGLAVGGFSARRSLRGESWGFLEYLSFTSRTAAAFVGFWLALALSPALVMVADPMGLFAAVSLAAMLSLWVLQFDRVFLRLLGARRLVRPDLKEALEAVAARAGVSMPRLSTVAPPGCSWANALAIPTGRRPTVAFTRALLEAFDGDETTAVFAHELAHLKHFSPRRLAVLAAVQLGLVSTGTFGTLAASALWPELLRSFWWIWPAGLALGLLAVVTRNKTHEAESDRLAAEWCGDPDALVRALVKLHVLGRLPRRWAAETERWSSHPSLASRIRAIRGDAAASTGLSEPVVAAGRSGAHVVFDPLRIHWLQGVPEETARDPAALHAAAESSRSVPYRDLVELHVRVGRRGRAYLEATSRSGRKWSTELTEGTAAVAQRALDGVDAQLAGAAAARREWRLLGLGDPPGLGGAELVSHTPDGTRQLLSSRLSVWCLDAPIDERVTTCFAGDGYETFVWRIGPATGERVHLATLPGWAGPAAVSSQGVVVVSNPDCQLGVVELPSGRVVDFGPVEGVSSVSQMAARGRAVTILAYDEDGRGVVSLYRLP